MSEPFNPNRPRCHWSNKDELYMRYHDEEWGVPVHDDTVHFEFLSLESAQSGLSWYTILKRRKGYNEAFADWNLDVIEQYDAAKVDELLQFEGIVRHRKKIESVIHNVKPFKAIQQEFGSFDNYIWAFVDGKPIVNRLDNVKDYPASTPLSDKIAKDLKKRGFRFLGTTTIYAYLQAAGLVDDHMTGCWKA